MRRKIRGVVEPYFALDRNSGNEILVTQENYLEYRDSVRYIQLDKPVPPEALNPVEKATKKATSKKSAKK